MFTNAKFLQMRIISKYVVEAEYVKVWKKPNVAYFKVIFLYFRKETDTNHRNSL
jgi:hypothetical protein